MDFIPEVCGTWVSFVKRNYKDCAPQFVVIITNKLGYKFSLVKG